MSQPFRTFLVWTYRVLPAIALALLIVLLAGILRQAPAVPPNPAASTAPPNPVAAQAAAEATKQAEAYKDEVKLYLEWIIAIAGIFTIAQTIAAGYAAQSFADQAEKSIKQIDDLRTSTATDLGTFKTNTATDIGTFKTDTTTAIGNLKSSTDKELKDFKQRYESVVLAENAREEALNELRTTYQNVSERGAADAASGPPAAATVGWLDWRLDLFGAMDLIKRQRLLSIDRYMGFDLQLDAIPDQAPRQNILRLLANFYVSKFDYETSRGAPNWMDLERAEYLLRLAIRPIDAPFWFYNDLGLVLVRYADRYKLLGDSAKSRAARVQAKLAYKQSCEIEPHQQRAFYNLARIEKDLGDASPESLKEAITLSERAIPIPNWEVKPDKSMQSDLVYNLACYKALLAWARVKNTPADFIDAAEADSVLKILGQLCVEGTVRKSVVDADFMLGGDLLGFSFQLAPAQKAQLADLRPRLSAHQPADSAP